MSWSLPTKATFDGSTYAHRSDYRDILKLMKLLSDETRPEFLRWFTAIQYFYLTPIPEDQTRAAMEYIGWFLTAGEEGVPGPRLFDWDQDAQLIAAEINRVAGFEIRRQEQVHWWTFLGYFRAIGQGQFSLVVGIRDKLRRGVPLEKHEQEYYRSHRRTLQLPQPPDPERQRLEQLLQPGAR